MRCSVVIHCFILLFVLVIQSSPARSQNLAFDHLTLEDGLSESTVLAIAQDAEGFMWFGTREGLNRYNARSIRVFRGERETAGSLSDSFIYALLSDRRGRLWVGTRNGLNRFHRESETFESIFSQPGNDRSLSDDAVTALMEARDGLIWVGTRRGLNLLDESDSISFMRFTHHPDSENSLVNDDIHSIYQDREGVIWIGTSDGVSRLEYKDANSYVFKSFRLPQEGGRYEKNNSVNCFGEDAYGRLILGTERSGLLFIDKHTLEFADVRGDAGIGSRAVRSIITDPSGNFWIGTIGGLFIANHNFTHLRRYRTLHQDPVSLSDNSIRSIFYDRDGSFWIGTFHGGINMYSPFGKQFRHLNPRLKGQSLNIKVASAMTTDEHDNYWIGTEGNGLFFLDPQLNVSEHFRHDADDNNSLSHDNVKCLLLEEGKGIWIGTIKGLDYYDLKRKKFFHFRNNAQGTNALPDDVIYDLAKDAHGNLWVATYFGGLARVNIESRVVEKIYSHDPRNPRSLSSQAVTRIFLDARQNVWVGTATGLDRLEVDGSFKRIFPGDSNRDLGIRYITTIFQDSRQRLWIGTRHTGLYLLSKDEKSYEHYSLSDGLPGNSIYALQEDGGGFIWISTENGLSRFDPQSVTFKKYDRSDGLFCKEFNFNSYHRDRKGYFYFGGYNGVAWFHPDSIRENRVVPRVMFTDVKLFNEPVRPDDESGVMTNVADRALNLEFRHDQNIFSVEFAVLNYINSSKNRFAYKLQGFEDSWNYVSEPRATYMNLAPGAYTLLVKGANNDGIWNEIAQVANIRVLPPLWKTWWAYTAYCSAFLLLLFGWARLNRKQLMLRHELQLEHLEKVKQDELHTAKLNFFTNVAHEIRTPVTLISSPVEHLLESGLRDEQVRKELIVVKNSTDRLMRLLNQLLDFQKQETGNVVLKISKGNIVGLVKEVVDSFHEFATSRKVALKFTVSEPVIVLWFDRDELSKVFYNLLVNALKFTPGGGEINVSILASATMGEMASGGSAVKVVIEDDGLGIGPDQLEKIFHRFYQAENTGMQDAGFGIGLALSKGIIDLHGGTISVESREANVHDAGFTRFTLTLQPGNSHFSPAQILRDEVHLPMFFDDGVGPLSAEAKEKPTGERPLILLVEDSDDIRAYMSAILSADYEVLESRNGEEGLNVAQERLPDLVISDIMMPVLDGVRLVTKLKADQRTNHIPVILLTARQAVNHQVEGLQTGADDYLMKPFNRNVLLVKIKNHLEIRSKLKEKYSRMVTLQPNDPQVADPDEEFLQRLMRILEEKLNDSEFNVTSLAKEIGMSRPVLFRKTKMLTGFSVIDLLRDVRLKKAEMLLRQKKMTISEVAFTVGFSDPKYFSKAFRNQYGKSPSQYIEEAS